MQNLLESIPEVKNDLTESQILEEIKLLNKHITIVEIIIKDLKKMNPVYTQESHEAIVSRYQEMYDNALHEREDYRQELKRFH